jgi:hypothetical protein
MRKIFYNSIWLSILTSCAGLTSDKQSACNCCEAAYSNIDSAMKCIAKYPQHHTTADNRLLLFAFVNSDKQPIQESGWSILKNQEVIELAKRNYLLITLSLKEAETLKGRKATELSGIIAEYKKTKEKRFFIITNQALYPFGSWGSYAQKDFIIDRLRVGIGP